MAGFLREFISSVNSGQCAIYVWDNETTPATCLVRRCGRLGWFLDDVKGPRNAEIDTLNLEIIYQSFAEAKVPQVSMIETVGMILGFDDDI